MKSGIQVDPSNVPVYTATSAYIDVPTNREGQHHTKIRVSKTLLDILQGSGLYASIHRNETLNCATVTEDMAWFTTGFIDLFPGRP